MLFAPLSVSASPYKADETDLTLNIDDSIWYVFTRGNLDGNPELSELGLDKDTFYDNMLSQNIYVDACLFYEDGDYLELLVLKEKQEQYVNFSNYEDSEVLRIGKTTFKDYEEKDSIEIYGDEYKYFGIEYVDQGINLLQYVTVINGEAYSFQFQSPDGFSEDEYAAVDAVMEGVSFDVDETMKEKGGFLGSLISGLVQRGVAIAILVGIAMVFAIPVIIVITIVKKRNAKKNDFNEL